MSAVIQGRTKSAADLIAFNVRAFIEVQSAYEQCSPEIRAAVDDMVSIVKSEDATDEERNRAVSTIVEALFPNLAADFLDTFSQIGHSKESLEYRDKMRADEESFARNVKEIMQTNGVTQEALAKLSGVGQSAISNMLNRNSRPQKRTVVKIAGALGVSPQALWPNFENGESD